MRSHLKFGAVLALLAACGEGPLEPGLFTLEGSWLGRGYPYELALDLQQDEENNVTGDGELRSLREDVWFDTTQLEPLVVDTTYDTVVVQRAPVDVSGDWDYPDFVITLRSQEYADVEYAGRFGTTSPDTVAGTLTGSGFTGQSIRILRQAQP